jgi:hypothetical protein
MKRRFLVAFAVLPLLAGSCAGLMAALTGETEDIDASTTVLHSDGTVTWAAKIDQFARAAANNKASRQRQVTQQQTIWKFVGYDYEFNQGELKAGIAQGKYKLGESVYIPSRGAYTGFDEYSMGSGGNYAYQVLVKTTENVTKTVTEVDQKLWQETYAESSARYQDYIITKWVKGDYDEDADENASPVRKKVMARLEERLRKNLLPGTELVYGGWTGGRYEQETVLWAFLADDGSFICSVLK